MGLHNSNSRLVYTHIYALEYMKTVRQLTSAPLFTPQHT